MVRSVGHAVPVVDHHRNPIVFFVDLVDERRQHVAAGVVAVLFQHLPQRLGESWTDPPDRLEQMRQEPHHVVVVVVDRQPGDRDAVAHEFLTPLRRQRALAEPRRRVNEDNSPPTARAKEVDEPAAGDQ